MVVVVVVRLWCCLSAVGFFFLLLVILMIYWMCWHPLLIKIIIHLLNTLRAAYGWMHIYLAHSSVHPFVRPSIHAFFRVPSIVRTMFTFCLFHLENFIPFVVLEQQVWPSLLSGLSSIKGTKGCVWETKKEMHGIFRFHSMAVGWTLTCLLSEDSSTKMWWSCGWVKKNLKKIKRNNTLPHKWKTKLKISKNMVRQEEPTANYINRINRFNGWYLLIQFKLNLFRFVRHAFIRSHTRICRCANFFFAGHFYLVLQWIFWRLCCQTEFQWAFCFHFWSIVHSGGAAHRVTDLLISDTMFNDAQLGRRA